MKLTAQVPPIPERRSEQTAARLARKVGPLFGVAWSDAPGGIGSWCCDYARLTLSEIMRGAPSPSRRTGSTTRDRGVADDAISSPIANVTAARFGPDTKAAFVLTGANELFAPIGEALVEAFEQCPVQEPEALLAVYAYIVLEILRSEPALILAATQAQTIQRALTAIQVPFATGGLTEFSPREWGAPKEIYDRQYAPDQLAILDKLADAVCRRLVPSQQMPTANEAESGLAPELRLRRLVVAMAEATLLDMSRNALDVGLRVVHTPDGRRADVLYEQAGRISRFMLAIAPHVEGVTFGSGARRGLEKRQAVAAFLNAPDVSGDNLTSRARLTVYGGLISGVSSAFPFADMAVRHAWGRAREQYADAIAKAIGRNHPEVHLARLQAMVDLIEYPVPSADDDPRLPPYATQRAAAIELARELLDRLASAAAAERISHGHIASVVSDLLVAINTVRRSQVLAPVPQLPDVASLNTLLRRLWDEQIARLHEFFAPDAESFIDRLHNYAGFLVGRGSDDSMFEQGLQLYLEPTTGILALRIRNDQPDNDNFGRTRRTRQIVVRALADRAHRMAETNRSQAIVDIELSRSHARELESNPGAKSLIDAAATSPAGNVTAAALIECYVTSVELGFGDHEDQAWCADRATALLDDAMQYVDGVPSRADRRIVLDELARRLAEAKRRQLPAARGVREIDQST